MPKSGPPLPEETIARVDDLLTGHAMPTYSDLTMALRQILSELQFAREHSTQPSVPAVQQACERIATNMLRRVHKL